LFQEKAGQRVGHLKQKLQAFNSPTSTSRVCLKTAGHHRTPQDTTGHRRTPQDTPQDTAVNEIKHYYKIKNRTSADKDIKISYD